MATNTFDYFRNTLEISRQFFFHFQGRENNENQRVSKLSETMASGGEGKRVGHFFTCQQKHLNNKNIYEAKIYMKDITFSEKEGRRVAHFSPVRKNILTTKIYEAKNIWKI